MTWTGFAQNACWLKLELELGLEFELDLELDCPFELEPEVDRGLEFDLEPDFHKTYHVLWRSCVWHEPELE